MDSLMVARDITRYLTAWSVAVGGVDVSKAREALHALTEPSRSNEVLPTGFFFDAMLALAQGKSSESRASLACVAESDRSLAATHQALLGLLPFAETPAAELERHLDFLRQWQPQDVVTPTIPFRASSREPASGPWSGRF